MSRPNPRRRLGDKPAGSSDLALLAEIQRLLRIEEEARKTSKQGRRS